MEVAKNKRAFHDYFITTTFEAGIKLTGTEIKSVRQNSCQITDSYVQFKNNRPVIINMFIAKYSHGNIFNHEERRTRDLLLHKKEINKLIVKVKQERYTMIPLKAYFVKSLLKIEFGLAKGKKDYDKREDAKEKDSKMRVQKVLKDRLY